MDRIRLFRLPLSPFPNSTQFLDRLNEALECKSSLTVSFVNPHAWHRYKHDSRYRQQLIDLDIVLADGIGVVKALEWVENHKIERISFDATSLYKPILNMARARGRRLFVIGAAPGIAECAAQRMQNEFPGISIAGHLHGHGDPDQAIETILAADPDLVLCGMGIPLQEEFILALRNAGFQGVSLTCGGFLDQLVRGERYYPDWIDRFELRWLYRLASEPHRLARRYLVEYQTFIIATVVALMRRKLQLWRQDSTGSGGTAGSLPG